MTDAAWWSAIDAGMPDEPDEDAAAALLAPTGTRAGGTVKGAYKPVDLAALFAAGLDTTPPRLLYRTDEACLFYEGAVNSVIGESESGKTWMTLLAAYQEIRAKRRVLFIDFEDTAIRVVKRLTELGLGQAEVVEFFAYIQPEGTFGEEQKAEFIEWGIADYSLVVMDGVTEAMSLHGKDGRQENDIAWFYELLPKWVASQGPAVVLIDHVPKSKDNRGGYAIGSQHKKAGITGASYTVTNKDPMGRGRHGRSWINLAKDKLGGVDYSESSPSSEKRFVGTLHVESDATMDFAVKAYIEPEAAKDAPATGVPTEGLSKEFVLRRALTDSAKSLGGAESKGAIKAGCSVGSNQARGEAIDYLAAHGYLGKVDRRFIYLKDYDGSETASSDA